MDEVRHEARRGGRNWLVALGGLYAAAVALYLVIAGRIALPLINPDEFT